MTTTVDKLTLRVRLFARYAELLGGAEFDVRVRPPATVADVLTALREAHPAARELPARPLAAVNLRQVALDAPVGPGDEIALLPPLSGG